MNENALTALLWTIGVILVVNFVMFGIVRGATRGDNTWIRSITETLKKPMEKSNQPYDELRKKLDELNQDEKKQE